MATMKVCRVEFTGMVSVFVSLWFSSECGSPIVGVSATVAEALLPRHDTGMEASWPRNSVVEYNYSLSVDFEADSVEMADELSSSSVSIELSLDRPFVVNSVSSSRW